MKPQDCGKYPTCQKIDSLADRDMTDLQFAEGVRKVCGECEEDICFYVTLEALADDRNIKRHIFELELRQELPQLKEGK